MRSPHTATKSSPHSMQLEKTLHSSEDPTQPKINKNFKKWNKEGNCLLKKKVWLYLLYLKEFRASLVAQWLRICLPMQRTQVRALVWEDPTCCGATGPLSHNYWACACRACAPQQEKPWQWEATTMRSPRTAMKSSRCSPQLGKACAQKRRPDTAKK